MSKDQKLEAERERWRERGRMDAKMKKKPHDEDTLRAVGGELALNAYREGYGGTKR